MKIRLSIGISLAFVLGALFLNGCKTTIDDPVYVPIAEMRFADFHQQTPLKIFVYPDNATHDDSLSWTPTPLTYGIVTPYFTNLSTNKQAGKLYHLVAFDPTFNSIEAKTDVLLKPGDKITWVISGPGGTYNQDTINDNPPANQDPKLAYYRFLNVTQGHTLDLVVGDPCTGFSLAKGVAYRQISNYVGIAVPASPLTFYVVENGNVLGRLAGVSPAPGAYYTVTFGGQDTSRGGFYRFHDPLTGQTTLNDTTRIRILNDDPTQGGDLTYAVPQTLRFNIINALLPPTPTHKGDTTFVDYTQRGGLAVIINNNTAFDYTGLMPFTVAPPQNSISNDGVFVEAPTSMPFNPNTDKLYIQFVSPKGNTPSQFDNILFRFYATPAGPGVQQFVSDQIYTVVVFDTVKKGDPKQLDYSAPYDSAAGVATIPIPDVPIKGSARIVLGEMLAGPFKTLPPTSNNLKVVFTVNDGVTTQTAKIKKVKDFDSSIVVKSGQAVTLDATINGEPDITAQFTPADCGIYEAFLVGQRGRPDDPAYKPRFIIVKVN